MKKYRVLYIAAAVVFTICCLWGGKLSALVFSLIMIVAPLISALQAWMAARGLAVDITGKHSCRRGQDMGLRLLLNSAGSRPLGRIGVQLVCENHVFGTEEIHQLILAPGRNKRAVYEVPLDSHNCGVRTISIKKIICWDGLGLFSCPVQAGQTFVCTVYPFESKMHADFSRYVDREQSGEIYDDAKSGMDVSEVFDLREYQEGDNLQSIHWKLSGKLNQLIVREFGRPINYHTLLLVDPAFTFDGQPVAENVLNGVFDLAASFSHALLQEDIAHFVGYLQKGQLRSMPVESEGSYQDMLMKLMNYPISQENDGTLYSFWDLQLHRRFTKVVYITASVHEEAVHYVANLLNLTVLQPVDGASDYQSGGSYELISVSTEEIRRHEHII